MTRRKATNFSADVLALNPELADLEPLQQQRSRAVACGWRVFRFTPEMIRSGEAFATMQDALVALPFT